MNDPYKLKKIPIDMYDEVDYTENKEMYFETFDRYKNEGCTVIQAVNGTYYYSFSTLMEENGMDKFIAMTSGMLYMIEHNEVDEDIANVMNYDIADFETGEYDEFFTPVDLQLLKDDIKIIKEYLSKHPEFFND